MSDASEIIKSGAADKLADIIHKLAGPLAEEFGMILGDLAKAYRMKNWVSVVQKTEEILRAAKLPPNAVPPRMFLPILESSSLENDETLQSLWAGLLASASEKSDSLSPSFIETLKQLTPYQATALESLFELAHTKTGDDPRKRVSFPPRSFSSVDDLESQLLTETFERLGLIRREYELTKVRRNLSDFKEAMLAGSTEIGVAYLSREVTKLPELDYELEFTKYGLEFMKACKGPKRP